MTAHDGLVSIGRVSRELGLSTQWVRVLTDQGVFQAQRTDGGHRRYDLAETRTAWLRHKLPQVADLGDSPHRTARTSPLGDLVADWTGFLANAEEDEVWRTIVAPVVAEERAQLVSVARYVFTEMLNNAIDHSGGTQAMVRVWKSEASMVMEIEDDGIGVFRRLADGKALPDLFAAVQQLTKGKQTTAPDQHSGEGIFFSSKAVDLFRLYANGLVWTVDNLRDDAAVGTSEVSTGTLVHVELDLATELVLADLFREFTDDNHHFNRTRPVVKLFGLGVTFVSRSEAKRLAIDLEDFAEVELDFTGVTEVGQAFVDELFRVWQRAHPDTMLTPTNMNDAVAFMVSRGLARPEQQ